MSAPTRVTTRLRCRAEIDRVADAGDWSHLGGRTCEDCSWGADRNEYYPTVGRPTRAGAWVTSDADGTGTDVIVHRLPDDPLVLDATPNLLKTPYIRH